MLEDVLHHQFAFLSELAVSFGLNLVIHRCINPGCVSSQHGGAEANSKVNLEINNLR